MVEQKGHEDTSNVPMWMKSLQRSIRDGNCVEAIIWARKLAQCRTKCWIVAETYLEVHVEKTNGVLGTLSVSVLPWMSIKELKDKVYFEHHFLPKLQKWFFQDELNTNDEVLLSRYGVDDSGQYLHDVHLYIRESVETAVASGNEEVVVHDDKLENEGCCRSNEKTEDGHQENGEDDEGWTCPACTFVNIPTRPGCEMCSESRPDHYVVPATYQIPEAEKERLRIEDQYETQARSSIKPVAVAPSKILEEIEQLDEKPLIENDEDFDCLVCFGEMKRGEGVKLRECFHTFCRACLRGHIANSETAGILCPFMDGTYSCTHFLLDREIKALSTPEMYEKYQMRSMSEVESGNPNTFHCKTPDCKGWCFYDDDANEFYCPVCRYINCLLCRAIHEPMGCREYQKWLKNKAQWDDHARKTAEALEDMVQNGEAMRCPTCRVVIQKKGGCDWMRCSVCRLEICWATRGPRWGPKGKFDTSGGCRCRVDGKQCHPDCQNCH